MPFSMIGAPACTFTPPGRKLWNARCAVMASALTPTMSRGRPGRCTSPAEIMVVTPPLRNEFDPAELVLPRRPVAEHRMHVAVDQARRDRAAVSVNGGFGAAGVAVLDAPDLRDAAIDRDDGVGVENRLFQRA